MKEKNMLNINDNYMKPQSRREFIQKMVRFGKLGLLGGGFNLLNRCTGSNPPDFEDLDPPFICVSPCNSDTYGGATSFNSGITTLIFSGYNNEAGFVGYNVWYGSHTDIINGHSNGDRSLVIDQTGSDTLDASALGSSLPSFQTSITINNTTFVQLTITSTASGNYIYISAYNSTDNIESSLSNGYQI